MRVLLRADASPDQGTGHVMRCLTLSEALIARGHDIMLLTNKSGVSWLEEAISELKFGVRYTVQHSLNVDECLAFKPDWVVVDSYEIPAHLVSDLNDEVPVLAIIDGAHRGIHANLYLDHNLGSETLDWPEQVSQRILAGSNFTLIRDAVMRQKRRFSEELYQEKSLPHVVAVMGGSDPTGTIVEVSKALTTYSGEITASIVVSDQWKAEVLSIVNCSEGIEIISPTPELPALFGTADIAISAAGTSAWELCTLGVPSVLVAVVENQRESLEVLIRNDLVLGIDTLRSGDVHLSQEVERMLDLLLTVPERRMRLSRNCLAMFDGLGKYRVVEAMEAQKTL